MSRVVDIFYDLKHGNTKKIQIFIFNAELRKEFNFELYNFKRSNRKRLYVTGN